MDQQTLDYGPGRRVDDPVTCQPLSTLERGRLAALIFDVHDICRNGLTDDELCRWLPDEHAPSVKTCRSRLSKGGVLFDTGATRTGDRGRQQIVWRAESHRRLP